MRKVASKAAAMSVVAALLASCTESSIYRTANFDGGTSAITDAKQRVLVNSSGNVTWGKNRPKRIICAEPSPDVAQALSSAISSSFAGAIQGKGNVSADVSASMSQGIVQLGERLGTIQLLRDGLFRACEAYSNGAISDATYSLIVSRVDQTMVALLGSEMAAGAFGRDLAAIGGGAGGDSGLGGADDTRVKELQGQAVAANREVEGKRQAVATAQASQDEAAAERDELPFGTDAATLKAANDKVAAASQKVQSARADLRSAEGGQAEIERQLAEARSASSYASTQVRPGGGISNAPAISNAKYIAEIQENFVNQDKIGPLVASCVTALDASSVRDAQPGRKSEFSPQRDEKGQFIDGPRTSPLAELCYQMMSAKGGNPSQLAVMMQGLNDHQENMAIIKSTKAIFDSYYEKCGTPEAAALQACKNMSKALSNLVLRRG
jgi:hypothetical protein